MRGQRKVGRVVRQCADSGLKAATDRKRKLAGVARNREMKGGRGFAAAAAAASLVLQQQYIKKKRPADRREPALTGPVLTQGKKSSQRAAEWAAKTGKHTSINSTSLLVPSSLQSSVFRLSASVFEVKAVDFLSVH